MTKFVKTSLAGIALAVALGGAAQAQETVAIGELSWDGQRAISYVMKAVIELRLGSKAEIKKAEAAVVMASMDKGDGGLDVYADMWMPNQTEKWNKYIDEAGTVDHNAAPYPGTQAIFVPTYIAEQGVRTIDDLKKPEVAAMFDSDGNGKGEYWPGAPGWNSTNRWAIKFRSYGLDDLWEAVPVDDAIFKSQLDGAYRKKNAILFYYWTPEWIHAAYDITPIEEPARYEGCEEVFQTADRED
jgi:glycine betaine/proline transport system substrate-binding protein